MQWPNYRCCSPGVIEGRLFHVCKMSQADREEINNPEAYPDIMWVLNPYKSGKRWARVVKPTYGCNTHEHKQQRCDCVGSRLNKSVIDVDRYMVVDEPPTLPTRPPVVEVKDKSLRETIMSWFKRDGSEDERLAGCKLDELDTAVAVVEFIVGNRHMHNEWAYNFPESQFGGTDALLAAIGHSCNYRAIDFNVSKHNAFRIWSEVLGRPAKHVIYDLTARNYQQLCKPLMSIAKTLTYPTDAKGVTDQAKRTMDAKKQITFFKLDGKWSVKLGNSVVDVAFGGIPVETQVTIGDFYQFLPHTGQCTINVIKGANQPLAIKIGRDFRIVEVQDKSGSDLESFAVDQGHVLLDMLMVYIPMSKVVYGD